jgi:hypothetical protein
MTAGKVGSMFKRMAVAGAAVVAVCAALAMIGCGEEDIITPVDPCAGVTAWTIISPKAGDTWKVGTPVTIKWCFAAGVTNARLSLSINDGVDFADLPTGGQISATSWTYTPTAANVGAACMVRVADYNNNNNGANSTVFSITN